MPKNKEVLKKWGDHDTKALGNRLKGFLLAKTELKYKTTVVDYNLLNKTEIHEYMNTWVLTDKCEESAGVGKIAILQ